MGTYVLTGGASGIGARLVKLLRKQGHNIINVDIKDADIIADLSTPAGRQAAVMAVRQRVSEGIDGLVPLAGIAGSGFPGALITSVNYFGTVEIVEGLRDLLAKKKAAVVLLCSNSAPSSAPDDRLINSLLAGDEADSIAISEQDNHGKHYMIGKRALAYWMRRNCMDYTQQGIRINAVAPGPIDTPMMKPLLEDPQMVEIINGLMAATPLGRPGQADEIAKVIMFLLSPDSSYVCGSVLFIDGGYDATVRPDHI